MPVDMEPTAAEKAKAFRAQLILYLVMALFVAAPFIFYWLRRK
jgi:hypothetical protein